MNSRTGRTERVYVDLEAVYPDPNGTREEYCFEELIARKRGWLNIKWEPESQSETSNLLENAEQHHRTDEETENQQTPTAVSEEVPVVGDRPPVPINVSEAQVNSQETTQELKPGRARKMKVREIKAEAQTSKIIISKRVVRSTKT